jgi:hypothetical protein
MQLLQLTLFFQLKLSYFVNELACFYIFFKVISSLSSVYLALCVVRSYMLPTHTRFLSNSVI